VLYLTKGLLIYNNSSLKLDSIINFPSYQSFTRGSAWGSARGFIRALRGALPKLRGALPKALHEALHEALLEALPEALSKAPSELRTKLCQDSA
jgi:hypothetical protein